MNFKLRNDINARTALVYGGAAFLLVIVGFRSIFATLDPEHIGIMTYLSIAALILEFVLLIFYAQSIQTLWIQFRSFNTVFTRKECVSFYKEAKL